MTLPEPGVLAALVLMPLVATIWGLSLWFFAVKGPGVRQLTLQAMTLLPFTYQETRACVLGGLYSLTGALAIFVLGEVFGIHVATAGTPAWLNVPLTVLGIIAEVSVTRLLVTVVIIPRFGTYRFKELDDTPWIRGIYDIPLGLGVVVAAVAGALEEFYFRGVALPILVDGLGLNALIAIGLVTLMFLVQQLIQVRSMFVGLVVGLGCIVISVVGAALVLATGSVIPAAVSHASFVVFFVRRS